MTALLVAAAMSACSSAPANTVQTGALVGGTGPLPGAISGMHYTAGKLSGYTDAQGHFKYRRGDNVVFSVGALQFEPVKGAALVSPFQLANGSGCAAGDALVHVLQILQSIDKDGKLDNGIQLPELPVGEPPKKVADLAAGDLAQVVQELKSGAALVDPAKALDVFIRQVDGEAWKKSDKGTSFGLPDAIYRSQGVATDGKSWFFSSENHLQRTNQSFVSQVDNAQPIPLQLFKLGDNHIGDIDVYDGLLYAPVEDGTAYQHPYVVTYDAQTLKPTGKTYLLPQKLQTKGVPWVAVDGPRKLVYTAEWDPTKQINMFDLTKNLALVKSLPLTTTIGLIQGAKVFGSEMYATSDDTDKSVYKIDLDTGTVIKLFALGTTNSEVEGLALTQEADGAHVHIENVVVPNVDFVDYVRTRAPLRDRICP